jgi:beta-glucosidase
VYVSQPGSPVLLPAKRLAGFTRVSVAAGSSRTVTVRVPLRNLGVVQGDVDAGGPPTLQHGQYVFSTGALTDAVTASAGNSVTLGR